MRAYSIAILSPRTIEALHTAGLTVVESDELAKCHEEIARLKRVIDKVQACYDEVRAELTSYENAI